MVNPLDLESGPVTYTGPPGVLPEDGRPACEFTKGDYRPGSRLCDGSPKLGIGPCNIHLVCIYNSEQYANLTGSAALTDSQRKIIDSIDGELPALDKIDAGHIRESCAFYHGMYDPRRAICNGVHRSDIAPCPLRVPCARIAIKNGSVEIIDEEPSEFLQRIILEAAQFYDPDFDATTASDFGVELKPRSGAIVVGGTKKRRRIRKKRKIKAITERCVFKTKKKKLAEPGFVIAKKRKKKKEPAEPGFVIVKNRKKKDGGDSGITVVKKAKKKE